MCSILLYGVVVVLRIIFWCCLLIEVPSMVDMMMAGCTRRLDLRRARATLTRQKSGDDFVWWCVLPCQAPGVRANTEERGR